MRLNGAGDCPSRCVPSVTPARHRLGIHGAARLLVVLIVSLAACGAAAAAAPCRGYPAVAARALKPRVEALRLIEREAVDRLRGLDTRTFDYLAGQARGAAATIDDAKALQDEDGLGRCPEPVAHVRRVCGMAALALAAALAEQAAGAASAVSKQAYGEAMAICEGFMGLAPLDSAFRIPDAR
jgi:hypothetical protein